MAKCDWAKFEQPAVTFCLLIKIVRPRQCGVCEGSNDSFPGMGPEDSVASEETVENAFFLVRHDVHYLYR